MKIRFQTMTFSSWNNLQLAKRIKVIGGGVMLTLPVWILVLRQKHESKIALNSESLPLKPQGMQEGS